MPYGSTPAGRVGKKALGGGTGKAATDCGSRACPRGMPVYRVVRGGTSQTYVLLPSNYELANIAVTATTFLADGKFHNCVKEY